MPIEIHSQSTLIGMNTVNAKLDIYGNGRQSLQLHTEQPQLNLEIDKPVIKIDQSACFAETGLKTVKQLIRDFANQGYQKAMEYISKTASQGNMMKDIHSGDDVFVTIAEQDADDFADKGELKLVSLPKSRPIITLERGSVKMNYIKGKVVNQTTVASLDTRYSPGKVEIFVRQQGYINMEYKPSSFNKYV